MRAVVCCPHDHWELLAFLPCRCGLARPALSLAVDLRRRCGERDLRLHRLAGGGDRLALAAFGGGRLLGRDRQRPAATDGFIQARDPVEAVGDPAALEEIVARFLVPAERAAKALAAEDADAARLRIRHHPAVGEDLVHVEAVGGHDEAAAVVAVHKHHVGLVVERRDACEEEHALQFAGARQRRVVRSVHARPAVGILPKETSVSGKAAHLRIAVHDHAAEAVDGALHADRAGQVDRHGGLHGIVEGGKLGRAARTPAVGLERHHHVLASDLRRDPQGQVVEVVPPARAGEAFGGRRELDLAGLHLAVSVTVHPEHAVAVARLPFVAVVVFHVRVVASKCLHEFLGWLPRLGVGILVGRTGAGEGFQRVVRQQFLDERRLAEGDDERPAILPVEAEVRARLTAENRHGHGRLLVVIDLEKRALPDPAGRILGIEAAARRAIRRGPEELLPHLPMRCALRDVVGRETLRRPALLFGHPEMSVG